MSTAFNKTLADPLWSVHVEFKGIWTMAGKTSPMTGTDDEDLGMWHAASSTGGTLRESISDGALTFSKQYGVWFRATNVKHVTLATMLAALKGFTDAGVEAKDGKQLHHMVLPAGTIVDASAIGIGGRDSDAKVTVDGWADDAGTPVGFTINAASNGAPGSASIPRSAAIEVTVASPAAAITLPTEDEQWVLRTSKPQHVQLALPATWQYHGGSASRFDFVEGYDGSFLAFGRGKSYGFSLNFITSYARSHLGQITSLKSVHLDKVSAGRLGGAQARILQYHGKYSGSTRYVYEVLAARGGYLYDMAVRFPRKPTAADKAMWAVFLASFKFK